MPNVRSTLKSSDYNAGSNSLVNISRTLDIARVWTGEVEITSLA